MEVTITLLLVLVMVMEPRVVLFHGNGSGWKKMWDEKLIFDCWPSLQIRNILNQILAKEVVVIARAEESNGRMDG